jgi:DNA-binding transcriptional ArsR family regulator
MQPVSMAGSWPQKTGQPMGANNVRALLLATPPLTYLPGRSVHCLLLIALRAHDDTGLYYGGLSWLQLQLGYQLNEGGRQNVLRHLKLLEKHGLLRRTGDRRGRKAVYQLTIPSPFGPVDNP